MNEGERRALWFYRLRGYRILGTNVWAGGNEIDLITRRGRRIVFCEVKTKSGDRYGDPLEMVGPEKQRRLRRAAEAWLAGLRLHLAEDQPLSAAYDEVELIAPPAGVRGQDPIPT